MTTMSENCIFCKIISKKISCKLIAESKKSIAFMDISPISQGHCLVVPKHHAQFMHQLPDDDLADILPLAKKVSIALGAENYNILQNNGRLAHQAVDHVHFHIIPKPNQETGLKIVWNPIKESESAISDTAEQLKARIPSS